ncbi:hypothetical protein [Variovorax sp. J31P207]|uniref:hypothetical protein n=1 Tax=Variovorax sp. J31P207 TaxID=3053510 RepID=UPI0025787570|nr:hypothetical protein [Variovorax sp. J31P207]MDM0072074.1 hypothetical protein [Variovorax sp. J31P207]
MNIDTDTGDLREHPPHPRRAPPLPSPRKIIDMHLPLTWLLSSIGAFALLLGGMYFQIGQLSKDLSELKSAVTAANAQNVGVIGDVAILKYRVDQVEKRLHEVR